MNSELESDACYRVYSWRHRVKAMEVTTSLAESNGSLPPGGWLEVTCELTACTPGLVLGPTLGNEYGRTLLFTFIAKKIKFSHTRYRALGPELIPVYRVYSGCYCHISHSLGTAFQCQAACAAGGWTFIAEQRLRHHRRAGLCAGCKHAH